MDANLVARLEAAVSKLEALGKGAPPAPPSKSSSVAGNAPAPGESPASKAWSDLTAGPLAKFLELSGKVGGVVKEQVSRPTCSGHVARPLTRFFSRPMSSLKRLLLWARLSPQRLSPSDRTPPRSRQS
jgi:hypothetical protein